MDRSGGSRQMEYLRKAHYYCKKACEYMEKAMKCSPCDGDRYRGYERYGDGCRRPRCYGEYRRNPYHMGSSSFNTYADTENLLDT